MVADTNPRTRCRAASRARWSVLRFTPGSLLQPIRPRRGPSGL